MNTYHKQLLATFLLKEESRVCNFVKHLVQKMRKEACYISNKEKTLHSGRLWSFNSISKHMKAHTHGLIESQFVITSEQNRSDLNHNHAFQRKLF